MSKCVVLIGPPCSGKSTIGKKLAENIGYKYVSSGDIARRIAQEDGDVDNLNAGKMAPENRMRVEIAKEFNEIRDMVLDGFPRFTEQWEWMTANFEYEFMYVVVDVPTLTLFNRVANRRRSDDASFMNRLEYYMKNTVHMINAIDHHCSMFGVKTALIMNDVADVAELSIERYMHDSGWI